MTGSVTPGDAREPPTEMAGATTLTVPSVSDAAIDPKRRNAPAHNQPGRFPYFGRLGVAVPMRSRGLDIPTSAA